MTDTYTRGNEIPTIDVALVVVKDSDGNRFGLDTSNRVQVNPVTETQDSVKLIVKGKLISQKPPKTTITGNTIVLTDNVFNAQLVQILQGGTITFSKKYSSQSASITTGKHHIVVVDDYLVFNVASAVTGTVEFNDASGVLEIVTATSRMRKSYTVESSAPTGSTAITVTGTADQTRVKKYTPPTTGEVFDSEPFVLECYTAIYTAAGLISGYEKISYPNCKGVPVSFSSEDGVYRAPEYTINSAPDKNESPYELEYVPYLPLLAN